MLPPHIKTAADLVTSHEMIREGFLRQAFTKTQEAEPYVAAALNFKKALPPQGG